MSTDTLGLPLVGALFVILGMCWYIVRLEDAADRREAAERTAAQLACVGNQLTGSRNVNDIPTPPEGAVKPAEPTYFTDEDIEDRAGLEAEVMFALSTNPPTGRTEA